MEKTIRQLIKEKVESENISLYSISMETKLSWSTVRNYVHTEIKPNPTTELLIRNYLAL